MPLRTLPIPAPMSLLLACALPLATLHADERVVFRRDVRPILSDKCFKCHGPDEKARQAGLRLDDGEDPSGVLGREAPADSELLRRIVSDDPDERMPPPSSKLELTGDERAVLQRWIQQGAPYEEHWAFTPIAPPPVPVVENSDWCRNEIDHFVLARLEQEGYRPAPQAGREALMRRWSFDLTGLPPTLEEIDTFLADTAAGADELVVDQLLSKEPYGERMAAQWLDVARYSDTYGYQVDRDRFVWPWRDWVIRSFNQNMPYDKFITWQLAGDLLPAAGDDGTLATTFNRLHPQKVEGGSTPEEFRVEYVADRTHTFATAFLGLTLECARCHDHKYDPISQREYYQLFAFFNNIDESGLYSYFTPAVPTPTLRLIDEPTRQRLRDLESAATRHQQRLEALRAERFDAFTAWRDEARRETEAVTPGQIAHIDGEQAAGANKTVPGKVGQALRLTGDDEVKLDVGNFRRFEPFSVATWLRTPDVKSRAVVWHRSRAWTDAGSRGYQLLIEDGKLSASLIHFWPGNAIRVRTAEPIPNGQWLHVAVTYDGSGRAAGLRIHVNGRRAPCEVVRDHLYKNITGGGGDHLAIGARFRDRGFTHGLVDEFRVFDRQLTDLEIGQLFDHQRLAGALGKPSAALSEEETQQLFDYYLFTRDEPFRAQLAALREARKAFCEAEDALSEIMVMREMPDRRPTYRLDRGAYDAPVEQVVPDTPRVLPPFRDELPRDRLGLAHWLTAPNHPLAARVAVNRLWQLCFGRGLVRTPEDFGNQGQPPTHPELLDWLAADFMAHGWDVKRMLKKIVLSATYQQGVVGDPRAMRGDPENRLLARAPAYRYPAEMIRDGALAVSGLLVEDIGGSPVRPYEVAASFKPVEHDQGRGLYRRSLYTFWKRTAPAPVMMSLDASKRDVCTVRRERTSSPLQALVLLNDPQLVEAARGLATRLTREHPDDLEGLLSDMFRWLTSRRASDRELAVIRAMYDEQLAYFEKHPERAEKFLGIGEAPRDTSLAVAPLAAASAVANTLLNFDDCVRKR